MMRRSNLVAETALRAPVRQVDDTSSTRAELIADGAVHGVGILLSIAAGSALLALAAMQTSAGEFVSLVFYVIALVTVFSVSCAYNLWPTTPAKQWLRRLDHAAIYLLIAATYTPFLTLLPVTNTVIILLIFIWTSTVAGISVKLFLPGRFDRLAVIFYLAIGWSGIAVFGQLLEALPTVSVWLMVAGGLLYSFGVIFFAWRSLKFQSAVWHGFVVAAAGVHFAAISDAMIFNRWL